MLPPPSAISLILLLPVLLSLSWQLAAGEDLDPSGFPGNFDPTIHAPSPPPPPDAKPAPVRRLQEDLLAIGDVRIDLKRRRVLIPAVVNIREGFIEYFCTTGYGAVHETVLRTEVLPVEVHLAMLLVSRGNQIPATPPASGEEGIEGPAVKVFVEWTEGGHSFSVEAGAMVRNEEKGASLSGIGWIYNGSRMRKNVFLAQSEGCIAAVMEVPNALINSKDPRRRNDDIWRAEKGRIPPVGTRVSLVLSLFH